MRMDMNIIKRDLEMEMVVTKEMEYAYVTGFGKIGLNAANNFFQYPRVKPYGSNFLEKIFMAEMDRHQLALAYDAVVSSGVL